MSTKYVPEGLTLMELAGINWVLAHIKTAILKGEPSGRAIDDALKEIMAHAGISRGYSFDDLSDASAEASPLEGSPDSEFSASVPDTSAG